MATLSEMFLSGIQKQEGTSLDSASGAAVGAQLAQLQQAKVAQKAALQKQAQDLEMAKLEKIGGAFDTWAKMPEGAGKKIYAEKFVPNLIMSLGYQDKIHPLNLEMMMKDQQIGAGVVAAIRNGANPQNLMDADWIAQNAPELMRLGSAQQISSFVADNPKQVGEAHNQYADDKQTESNAHIAGKYAAQKQAVDIATSGQVKADEAFGKDMPEYVTKGTALATKNIDRLRGALQTLSSGNVDTKSYRSKIPYIGNALLELSQPEIATIRDDIRNAIQGGLKEVLGGQYTAQEGEDMFNRAFNTSFDAKENARRTMQELAALENMKANKDAAVAYFREKGTLSGFGGGSAQPKSPKQPVDKDAAAQQHISAMSKEKLETFIKANPKNKYTPWARKQLLKLNAKKK